MANGVAGSVAQWKAATASSVNGTLPRVWRTLRQKPARTRVSSSRSWDWFMASKVAIRRRLARGADLLKPPRITEDSNERQGSGRHRYRWCIGIGRRHGIGAGRGRRQGRHLRFAGRAGGKEG